MASTHLPVMAREAIRYLRCMPGQLYVDGTVGGAGHALEILKESSPDGRLVGLDQDPAALERAGKALEKYAGRVTLVRENFRNLAGVLEGLGVRGVDGVLYDLGVSSFQLDTPGRGFSFRFSARLDMRMDPEAGTSAYELVNALPAEELERIFRLYGEERFSKRIAGEIERARRKAPLETTVELAELVSRAIPRKFHQKNIHPATRVFQALRMAVNEELESLEEGIEAGFGALNPGGRLVVISFHSLEDRIVKNAFRGLSTGCVCPPRAPKCVCGRTPRARLLTRKAAVPGPEETEANPRARSAKLRAIEKI